MFFEMLYLSLFFNTEDKTVGPSVCVHTHVQFGLQHIEQDKEQVKKLILQHLRARLPELPEPTEVKSQKWRYSQVCVLLSNLKYS